MIPSTARRITRRVEQEVPTSDLTVEQLVLVQPHEFFPADGVITEGTTSVDERSITGAEQPVEKLPSSRVYAGTQNVSGKVLVRLTAVGDNTIARRIETFMQRQQAQRSEPVSFFARATQFMRRAPDTNVQLQALAEKGIFVAGSEVLQKLRSVDTLVFDKTGIITTGAMHVMHVVSFKPYTQQQVLNTAAALEAHSKHLTARAVVHFARVHGASALQRVDEVKEEPGLGVSGKLNGKVVFVGNAAFLQRKKVKIPKEALEHKAEGETVVYVVSGKDVLGYLALSNSLKSNVKTVMHELKKHYRVIMLSGDHQDTAAAIGLQANMHEVIAEVRAEKREEEIAALQRKGKTVAYITALHTTRMADVTITMGTRAAFSGDVSILHGDLESIHQLFHSIYT
jgi:cation transport ATPase